MVDTYDAVFQAAYQKIGRCDTQSAVEAALREAFGHASHYIEMATREYQIAAQEQQRPCVLFRPRVGLDGNKWGVLYGDNIQDGVYGSGDSVAEAMADFDRNWYAKLPGNAP